MMMLIRGSSIVQYFLLDSFTLFTLSKMPRKQSPTSVAIPEQEENKYQKKRRRHRHGATPRLSWPTFGMLYCIGTVFLIWRMAADSASYRSKLLDLEKFKRAMKLQRQRNSNPKQGTSSSLRKKEETPNLPLQEEFQSLEHAIVNNVAGGPLFIRPHLLPPLPGQPEKAKTVGKTRASPKSKTLYDGVDAFKAHRKGTEMAWLTDNVEENKPPRVDYTKHDYEYPKLMDTPPEQGGYPQLETLGEMLTRWPQNNMDDPPTPIVEHLLHFNYSNPKERATALTFRKAELPFKLYDVPEVTEAGIKWTDDYVSQHFDKAHPIWSSGPPRSKGTCQESPNHFFAFFTPPLWKVGTMGVPPTRTNDWSFQMWARHAKYADSVGLTEDRPHFYWQSGVPKEERHERQSQWTFVSKDLPSFSSPTDTFFVFDVEQQKGIQCRFGERGVTAATHYDSGRNMIAMVTGAKRYILSPPRECSKLGIVTERENAIFRHSLLNFGNLDYLETEQGKNMSADERAWLERAKNSMAVDTVLKAGEVLYIPSHWFHYITSLQKSAQCNVRSGVEKEGTDEFGGARDVRKCSD